MGLIDQPARRTTYRGGFVGHWLWTYVNSPAPHYAPAIAFNAFVAMFPVAAGLIALLVMLSPERGITGEVDRVILSVFPAASRRDIQHLLTTVAQHAGTIGLLSVLAMAWSGSALFSCLAGALNAIHGTPGRSLIQQRLMGLRLIVVVMVSIGFIVAFQAITGRAARSPLVGLPVGVVVIALLVAFVYRVAPNRHIALLQALPGAAIAAVLIELVTLTFPLYARVADLSSTYGRGIALPLVLLTWLYLLSHVVLLGAWFNESREREQARRVALAAV